MVEQTQEHISALGVKNPTHLATDQRHVESSSYPFMGYDILGEETDQEDMSCACTFDLKNHWSYSLKYPECYVDPIYDPDVIESAGLQHDIQCWHEQGGMVSISILPDILPHMNWLMVKGQASSSISGLEGKQLCFGCKNGQELCHSNSATAKIFGHAAQGICTPRVCGAQEVCRGWSLDHWQWGRLYPRVGHYLEAPGWSPLGSQRLGALHDCVWREFYWQGIVFSRSWPLSYVSEICSTRWAFWHDSSYLPGDIVIFCSLYLFHAIGHWKPGPMLSHHTCTPGRLSWVHFTHSNIHRKLKDKPAGYFIQNGQFNEVETLV